ncbi:MAG: YdcF family protein [Proteobacteria bacterium]|nr:YdcF family protein [Pseudomonadota bacterium]MCH8213690.1 YdcF family protein [Pseudomonadota bacterium]
MAAGHDVIVILGAGLGPALRRRVAHGTRLFHAGRAGHLIVTGGAIGTRPTEAEAMRALALRHGVPEERIIVEDKATHTLENALYTARIMEDRGWARALVVSDPFHLPRALFLFRRLGIAASGAAVRERCGEPRWRWYGGYVREAGAFATTVLRLLGRRDKRRDKRIAQTKGQG